MIFNCFKRLKSRELSWIPFILQTVFVLHTDLGTWGQIRQERGPSCHWTTQDFVWIRKISSSHWCSPTPGTQLSEHRLDFSPTRPLFSPSSTASTSTARPKGKALGRSPQYTFRSSSYGLLNESKPSIHILTLTLRKGKFSIGSWGQRWTTMTGTRCLDAPRRRQLSAMLRGRQLTRRGR